MVSIVLVEDNKIVLKMLAKRIEYFFKDSIITTFCNPIKALKNIPEMNHTPDIIISDYMMFDMDGITMIENLRKLNINSKYLLLTSFKDINLYQECYKKNIPILNKGTDINLLLGVIYNVEHNHN